ncbi:GTP-binding protein beta subunit [Colletotrichum sp. SAR 10_76]|nr:GTP-binding protein beta subunit [Colletotrichum sp. SAR 10_76]
MDWQPCGSSTLHVHNTADPAIPITQSISGAHKLGCHHICTSRDGRVAASAGFAGELKVWVVDKDTGEWKLHSEVTDQNSKAGETWAIALSEDGKFLAGTTYDGRINVWDIGEEGTPKIREYETGSPGSGSFGMSVDLSRDGKFTASGHQNGSVYLFNNDTGRLASSLPGLAKPVRAVAFSPGNTRLAAAGDSSIIAIYDLKHGEQVGNLTGHSSWITSIDWSDTGEYLLSGAMDGKVKVWSVERYACVATHSETDKALWSVKWLPKTGRSGARARPGPARGQSTISFSHKVSKPVPKDLKKAAVLGSAVERAEQAKKEEAVQVDEIQVDEPETKEEEEVEEEVPEKSKAVIRAEKISDAQINKYWKSIEAERIAPRVHQKDVTLAEKVLRYFDVSSQYGPCIGLQRMKRWERADRLGLNPPIEVLAVLLKEEKKGTSNIERAHMDELMNSTAVGSV